jgi:alkanesulfonate monooxygenase SsuD/methylene tetrahydromethanopterin reductase-like flavin-dependent oxidoreductase (luciferase family)
MSTIGRERGWSPMTSGQFEALRSPRGSLLIGSPQDVIDKMLYEHELFHYDRFLMHLSVGTMPHDKVMRAIELLGTKVSPTVRKALGRADESDTSGSLARVQ